MKTRFSLATVPVMFAAVVLVCGILAAPRVSVGIPLNPVEPSDITTIPLSDQRVQRITHSTQWKAIEHMLQTSGYHNVHDTQGSGTYDAGTGVVVFDTYRNDNISRNAVIHYAEGMNDSTGVPYTFWAYSLLYSSGGQAVSQTYVWDSAADAGIEPLRRSILIDWGACFGGWCGGAVLGCAIAGAIWAEVPFAPCVTVGCVTAFVGCTVQAVVSAMR